MDLPHRFRPYLAAANNDHAAALDLYEWNARVSASFLEVFHSTRDPRDAVLGELIKESRAAGWTEFESYQVFFLTVPGEPGHISLSAPLANSRSGRGSACVQRQRYVRVNDLLAAATTADLPAWR